MPNKRRKRNAAKPEFYVYTPGVPVPRNTIRLLVPPGVGALPAGVFRKLTHLREVVLSEGLREIGQAAFGHCRSLRRVKLPSSLREIGGYAFFDCTALVTLEIPEGLVEVGEHAFNGCASLMGVRLPSTITTIGDWAFYRCALEDIILPVTLNVIGRNAFYGRTPVEVYNSSRTVSMVKFYGGRAWSIEEDAFEACRFLDQVGIFTRAVLVVTESEGCHNFLLVTKGWGTVPRTNPPQALISSECFNSMDAMAMSEVWPAIADIAKRATGRRIDRSVSLQSGWPLQPTVQEGGAVATRDRLRALLAPHEVRHRKVIVAILELALWKTKADSAERANPEVRQGYRLTCGAGVIIPNVLPFL